MSKYKNYYINHTTIDLIKNTIIPALTRQNEGKPITFTDAIHTMVVFYIKKNGLIKSDF